MSYWRSQKTMLVAAARIFTYPSHSFTDIRAKGRLGSQSCSTKSDHGSFCYNLLVRNNNNEFTTKIDELETTTRGLNDKRKNSKTGLTSVPMETPSINGCESIQKIECKSFCRHDNGAHVVLFGVSSACCQSIP